jgi:hypothetical protein
VEQAETKKLDMISEKKRNNGDFMTVGSFWSLNYTCITGKVIISGMKEDWQRKIKTELDQAQSARSEGNEGRARVCARRAAGIAVREYFNRKGKRISGSSAYELLNCLEGSPDILTELKQFAAHLTLRVSEDFTLPADIDLVEESRQLCSALLPDWNPKINS